MTAPIAYPIAEAAQVAGVSVDTLRRAIHSDRPPYLKAKKLGARILITRDALAEWLSQLPDA